MTQEKDQELLSLAGLAAMVLLAAFLVLPSRMELMFDGLPWSHRSEFWVAAGVLPLLAILDRSYLNQRLPYLALALLVVLKLVMSIMAPAGGWEARVYATPRAVQEGQWERTYSTFWRPGLSELLDRPWSNAREFPIEWMNRGPTPPPGGFWLGVEFQGMARVPEGAGLAVVASGLEGGSVKGYDVSGGFREAPLVPGLAEASRLDPAALPGGAFKVEGRLRYGPGNWSLVPVLVWPGGRVEPAFQQGVLWRNQSGLTISSGRLEVWLALAKAINYGFLAWLTGWAFWALGALWRRRIVDAWLVLLMALTAGLPHLLVRHISDPVHLLPLAAAAVLASAGLALDAGLRPAAWAPRAGRPGLTVLAVLGPGVLAWFLWLYGSEAGAMTFYSQGDDWLTYQNLARRIFLTRDWLDAADGVWHMQPIYRYVVGALHTLFGQSAAAQNLLDVWSALGTAAVTTAVARLLGLGTWPALLAGFLFLAPELLGPFRYHLGRGLQEHLGMFAVIATAWAVLRAGTKGFWGALLAGGAAVLAFWVRQDHLGVLASLGLFCLEPGQGGTATAWRTFWMSFGEKWRWLAVYLGVLGAGALLVALHNWWFGGLFTLIAPGNLNFLNIHTWDGRAWNYYVLLAASEGQPSWTAWLLVPGTLLGLLTLVWRPGELRRYPLALGMSLAGLLAPYLYVKVSAYPPRFSLHLLPLAALSLALGLGLLIERRLGRRRVEKPPTGT